MILYSYMFNIDKSINKMLGKKLKFPKLFSKPSKRDWDGDGILNPKDCQPFNITRQDIIGYHGSSEADKIRKEGFKPGPVFLSPSKEGALAFTAKRDKYVKGYGYGLSGKTDERKVLEVTATKEYKYVDRQAYFNEINNELRKYNQPPIPWRFEMTPEQSKILGIATQKAIQQLKAKGYRGVMHSGEIQVFDARDIVSIK